MECFAKGGRVVLLKKPQQHEKDTEHYDTPNHDRSGGIYWFSDPTSSPHTVETFGGRGAHAAAIVKKPIKR